MSHPAFPSHGGLPHGGRIANARLFFRRWLANPLQMGSIVPSSPALCRRIARHARCRDDELVVELGAGTGVISQALLESGVAAHRLVVVEIVPALAEHLGHILPGVRVVQGDARALPELVAGDARRVGSVVCGVPLVLLPLREQRRFVASMIAVAGARGFLHYSYCVTSPLPAGRLGLTAKRVAWTPLNVPPASVWRYVPAD